MKCGTSSLHQCLDDHPGICMPRIKETDFFKTNENYQAGMEQYLGYFSGDGIRGEISPNYSKCHLFPGVPERIHQALPDARLLYIVRDPLERIIFSTTSENGVAVVVVM